MRHFALSLILAAGILASGVGFATAHAALDSTQTPVGGSVQSEWVNG